jgi:hypothetical protein
LIFKECVQSKKAVQKDAKEKRLRKRRRRRW